MEEIDLLEATGRKKKLRKLLAPTPTSNIVELLNDVLLCQCSSHI